LCLTLQSKEKCLNFDNLGKLWACTLKTEVPCAANFSLEKSNPFPSELESIQKGKVGPLSDKDHRASAELSALPQHRGVGIYLSVAQI